MSFSEQRQEKLRDKNEEGKGRRSCDRRLKVAAERWRETPQARPTLRLQILKVATLFASLTSICGAEASGLSLGFWGLDNVGSEGFFRS